MAGVYMDEEEIWKCQKHPSKRHRSGICPTCLRDHLKSLCPECGNARPCSCCAVTTSSSSSSSLSSSSFFSFSRFSASGRENFGAGIGTVGPVSNLIQSEPEFRRSRSVSLPFLRSKSKSNFVERVDTVGNEVNHERSNGKTTTSSSPFWSWLKRGNNNHTNDKIKRGGDVEEERRVMMRKSRSVAVRTSDYGKSKGGKWYFTSPIKVFRQSRLAKVVVQERSPMCRG